MKANLNKISSLRPDYDFPLNALADDFSPRGLIYSAISNGSRVLDVGCDTGRFGEMLITEKGCSVDGIEAWHHAAEIAKTRLHNVHSHLIENEQSFNGLENYDAVLFLCVLEHLQDPWAALRGALIALKTGGSVYVIVPNVAHISIVRRLLLGQFDYTEHGAMDRTHLRWFTRKSLRKCLEESGFSEVKVQGIPLVPYLGSSSPTRKFLSNMSGKLLPDLFYGSIVGCGIKPIPSEELMN